VVKWLQAMAWNYVYNYGYDKIFGADKTKRTKKTRVLHGLGFELGLMTVTLPVLMWVLKLDFLTILIMDIGLVILFLLYAIGFNWAYDAVWIWHFLSKLKYIRVYSRFSNI